MSKTINLNIPRSAAERVAQEDIFVCSGCGKPAPSKIKSCDCATMVGFRMRGGKIEHSLLVDPHALIPPPQADREAVREAELSQARARIDELEKARKTEYEVMRKVLLAASVFMKRRYNPEWAHDREILQVVELALCTAKPRPALSGDDKEETRG